MVKISPFWSGSPFSQFKRTIANVKHLFPKSFSEIFYDILEHIYTSTCNRIQSNRRPSNSNSVLLSTKERKKKRLFLQHNHSILSLLHFFFFLSFLRFALPSCVLAASVRPFHLILATFRSFPSWSYLLFFHIFH